MDGNIRYNVSANTAQFTAGMANVSNAANTAAGKIKSAFSGLGGLLVGGAALAGLKSMMNELDGVAKMATRFGASAESIQRVSLAANLAGTSIDVVAQAMQKVGIAASKANREGGAVAETFALAGINAEEFNSSDLDKKLVLVAKAFEAARGDADKTNAIIELLGSRSAGQLIPLISNVGALQSEMAGAAVTSDDMVRKIESANDSMTRYAHSIKVATMNLVDFLVIKPAERLGDILSGGIGRTESEVNDFIERQNAENRLRTRGELLPDDSARRRITIPTPAGPVLSEGEELIPGPNAEENARRINAEIEKMRAELEAVAVVTEQIADEADEEISKGEERRQQLQQIHEIALQIREAEADGNRALAEDLQEYKSLIEAAIKYEGDLEMAARDVNAAHRERLRLQEEALQKSIAQVEKEVELAEVMAFGSDEAKTRAKWTKEYDEVLEKTGREDLARRAANAAVAEPEAKPFERTVPERRALSAMERLRESAGEFNTAAMAEESRIAARGAPGERRASQLESRGLFSAAANIREREERNRQRSAERFLERQTAMAEDASKTEKQRERAAAAVAQAEKSRDSGKSLADIWQELKELNTKLPQNALA
jgi:hypothetical protein